MKIGIIGLRPRQYSDLRARNINGHELVFFEDKTCGREQVAAFTRKVDHVILLPNAAPKKVSEWVLKDKLKTLVGGISTVIRYVEQLPSEHASGVRERALARSIIRKGTEPQTMPNPHTIDPLIVESAQPKVPDVATEQQPVADKPIATFTAHSLAKPPRKLGQTIPKGRQSEYEWSPDVSMVKPDTYGNHRYELLDAAIPGDVVRFARPKHVPFDVWRLRLTSMRYSREKSKGQFLEVHYYENYADMLVVNPDGTALVKTPAEEPAPQSMGETTDRMATSTYERAAEAGTIVDHRARDNEPGVQLTNAVGNYDGGKVQFDYVPAPVKRVATDRERTFWREVYLLSLGQGAHSERAAVSADEALAEYRKRFEA